MKIYLFKYIVALLAILRTSRQLFLTQPYCMFTHIYCLYTTLSQWQDLWRKLVLPKKKLCRDVLWRPKQWQKYCIAFTKYIDCVHCVHWTHCMHSVCRTSDRTLIPSGWSASFGQTYIYIHIYLICYVMSTCAHVPMHLSMSTLSRQMDRSPTVLRVATREDAQELAPPTPDPMAGCRRKGQRALGKR